MLRPAWACVDLRASNCPVKTSTARLRIRSIASPPRPLGLMACRCQHADQQISRSNQIPLPSNPQGRGLPLPQGQFPQVCCRAESRRTPLEPFKTLGKTAKIHSRAPPNQSRTIQNDPAALPSHFWISKVMQIVPDRPTVVPLLF